MLRHADLYGQRELSRGKNMQTHSKEGTPVKNDSVSQRDLKIVQEHREHDSGNKASGKNAKKGKQKQKKVEQGC